MDFVENQVPSLRKELTVPFKDDQVPLLMLPKKKDAAMVEFYDLQKGQVVYKHNLPETKAKFCFSSLGWLITIQISGDEGDEGDIEFNLIHPFEHEKIELPDGSLLTASLRYPKNIMKFVLSSSPSSTQDYIVMFHSSSKLGFCRPGLGEEYWTTVVFWCRTYIMDLACYEGNFYVVGSSGRVCVVCQLEDPKQAHLRVVAPDIPQELLGPMEHIKALYLVESAGSLLVVLCSFKIGDYESTIRCRVFKLPFSSNGDSWSNTEVKNLGNRALFLSTSSSSFSIEVDSENSGYCKPNCIYFINNKIVSPVIHLDVGMYNMEDGTVDPNFGNSFKTGFQEVRDSSLWIQPS